jgi:hypothetical protein
MSAEARKPKTDDEVIAALERNESISATARDLGISRSSVQERIKSLALKGYSPKHNMTHPVPDGFMVKGVSTLYREDGTVAQQWVKSTQDAAAVRRMIEAVMSGLCATIPREKPVKAPKHEPNDMLNLFLVTDYHMGMLSWREETGADWDLAIAEDMLVSWFKHAIKESPKAGVAVFGQLGDFLHWDGWDAVTPSSKHLLDADTRFPKLVEVACRAIKRIIKMLLSKHHRVHVIMAEGNHDPTSSVWLRKLCASMFEDEPRVFVDLRPDPYYCIEHGKTALLFHHGHKKRLVGIDKTFVAKFREVFGRTTRAYAHMGHLHHIEVKETELMVVEQHRTLAAPDAYASRAGFMSGREAQVITYSKTLGERHRSTIPAQLVIDMQEAA